MKKLADILGIANAFDIDPMPTTVIERQEVENPTAQQFALSILESPEYRQSLLRRILTDDLPPAVETKLMDYGWGKPKETIEHLVKTTRVVREIVDPSFDDDEEQAPARVN
jgi:hypothetical protein